MTQTNLSKTSKISDFAFRRASNITPAFDLGPFLEMEERCQNYYISHGIRKNLAKSAAVLKEEIEMNFELLRLLITQDPVSFCNCQILKKETLKREWEFDFESFYDLHNEEYIFPKKFENKFSTKKIIDHIKSKFSNYYSFDESESEITIIDADIGNINQRLCAIKIDESYRKVLEDYCKERILDKATACGKNIYMLAIVDKNGNINHIVDKFQENYNDNNTKEKYLILSNSTFGKIPNTNILFCSADSELEAIKKLLRNRTVKFKAFQTTDDAFSFYKNINPICTKSIFDHLRNFRINHDFIASLQKPLDRIEIPC